MKASVIIPMYNEERYISRCLSSLEKQSFQDFETILIDDGSTDKTIEMAEKFNVKILKQEHGGPGKARNLGAREAKGDILIFVDADMFFDKKYIEYLIAPIEDGKEIGTSHGTELVGNLENPIARAYGITRGVYDSNKPRCGIYRAILKKEFLNSGGFDPSKGYFDDNLNDINGGLGSLNIEKAACYHNNPESFKEIFHHSVWVGNGLILGGGLVPYAKAYKFWIIAFLLSIPLATWLAVQKEVVAISLAMPILAVIILVGAKTVQRTLKEKYLSHLAYLPICMIARGAGYAVGIMQGIAKSRKR